MLSEVTTLFHSWFSTTFSFLFYAQKLKQQSSTFLEMQVVSSQNIQKYYINHYKSTVKWSVQIDLSYTIALK